MRAVLAAAAVTLAAATTCPAQVFEIGGFGGVSRLRNRDIGTLQVGSVDRISIQDGWRMGMRMTFNQWQFAGYEVGYAYNRANWRLESTPPEQAGSAIHQGMFNFLLYGTREGSTVRPFATGGAHFSNFIYPGLSVTQGGGSNKIGYNYGGGVKVKVSPKYAIRLDYRQYVTGKPFDLPNQSGRIRQIEISAGFLLIL
jgi:opacity protein-like surface antigen